MLHFRSKLKMLQTSGYHARLFPAEKGKPVDTAHIREAAPPHH
jgi:hypothetical protein